MTDDLTKVELQPNTAAALASAIVVLNLEPAAAALFAQIVSMGYKDGVIAALAWVQAETPNISKAAGLAP